MASQQTAATELTQPSPIRLGRVLPPERPIFGHQLTVTSMSKFCVCDYGLPTSKFRRIKRIFPFLDYAYPGKNAKIHRSPQDAIPTQAISLRCPGYFQRRSCVRRSIQRVQLRLHIFRRPLPPLQTSFQPGLMSMRSSGHQHYHAMAHTSYSTRQAVHQTASGGRTAETRMAI